MDDNARLQLNKMIKANDVEDVTELIRELKHSHLLQADINALLKLKVLHKNDMDKVHLDGMTACAFLFTYYTDIYNKIRKDEIDLTIFNKFLVILKKIEDEEVDQHEGSFLVGTLLKEMYIDSAIKKADKFDRENPQENVEEIPHINISWKDFKTKYNIK